MKKRFFTFKNLFACLTILYALYMIVTTIFYDRHSAFNYSAFFSFLFFLFIGVILLFQKNRPFEKRRLIVLFWTLVVTAFAILIATVITQQKQIEKLQKMDQSKNIIK